ncbi:RNA polymerase sigma-70 factor (ECF subfamily) [Desulfohalotomaculum tongense]|uniref:RNA polymerase sigma factor n=1 Tax=Desulforadius tongensis TaxID=1216062 RepID=UPI00195B3318|nr:sigma-70 family RNA polymerase sigma factor [Desulforadius tongensis]MBM7855008.1 RNA polymerase sigma-70 factor (ECF subfamily) [Desulforadius tongensis]
MIDELLVKKAVNGDAAAFLKLSKQYQQPLYRTAMGMLGNEHDAADAVQDAFLKAYRDIGKLRDPRQFRSWLYRILINRCIDILRQRRRTTPVERVWLSDPVENNIESRVDISQAVAELDEQHRAVVVLRFFQDMKIDDIALVLNCPVGTVKSRLYRALKKLKLLLTKDSGLGGEPVDLC